MNKSFTFLQWFALMAVFLLLGWGSARPAAAIELSEADCRCCHTSGVPDRHHLLVQTRNAVCLDCHRMVMNTATGSLEAEVVRDCIACHTASLADRHHLAASSQNTECLGCHAVLLDPATGSFYVDFNMGCRTAAPAEACTDGVDNDGDALADCADPDCVSTAVCLPAAQAEVCTDATDNDGDTLADCDDPDCGGTAPGRPAITPCTPRCRATAPGATSPTSSTSTGNAVRAATRVRPPR